MLKKTVFIAMSLFLAFRSYELLQALMATEPEELGAKGELLMALLLSVFLTGMVAIPGFALPTHTLLNRKYYVVKNADLTQKMYKALQVEHFRKMLMWVFWGRKTNRKKFFDGKASGIDNFLYQSKQAEFGHILSFLLLLVACIPLLIKEYYLLVPVASFINVLGNLYPVILQRAHRIRIDKVLRLRKRREMAKIDS